MAAPFIGPVSIRDYLPSGQIEQVIAGGENYDGSRPLDFAWVKNLYDECVAFNTTFCFIETGSCFVKDGRVYRIPDKGVQSRQAFKSGLQHQGNRRTSNLRRRFSPHCSAIRKFTGSPFAAVAIPAAAV